jgi:hypothetical protein
MVQEGVPSDLVMDWGGWQDHRPFENTTEKASIKKYENILIGLLTINLILL